MQNLLEEGPSLVPRESRPWQSSVNSFTKILMSQYLAHAARLTGHLHVALAAWPSPPSCLCSRTRLAAREGREFPRLNRKFGHFFRIEIVFVICLLTSKTERLLRILLLFGGGGFTLEN